MRKVILQLFLNETHVKREIEDLQSKPSKDWNHQLIEAKHKEWDRYTHMINLFFESVNL